MSPEQKWTNQHRQEKIPQPSPLEEGAVSFEAKQSGSPAAATVSLEEERRRRKLQRKKEWYSRNKERVRRSDMEWYNGRSLCISSAAGFDEEMKTEIITLYTTERPLWAAENIRKGNRILPEFAHLVAA